MLVCISVTLCVPKTKILLAIIREYDASGGPPGPASEYLVPEDPDHPRNWPALPAVETIWSYVRRFETLEWIAFRGDTEDGIIESSSDEVSILLSGRIPSLTELP